MSFDEIVAALRAAGIENALGEARMLVERFSGDELSAAVERRLAHYPLQYILGEWGFYRETYEVNEHCLVPRSDTEILVDAAVRTLPNGACFLDLCTGSGCIAVSVLASRPDTAATAVDLFPETLALAGRNAARNGVADRATFIKADVTKAPSETPFPRGSFDAILSNPPYIPDAVVPTLQTEVGFEPAAALCGGEDGMDFYRAILLRWTPLLKAGGRIFFEIGYDQGEAICALAKNHGFSCTVMQDFGKNDRVAVLSPL